MSQNNNRAATGIIGLDDMLGGGLPRNALILAAGNPGSGKTILSAQFLSRGCIEGEKGIYASFAETRQDFMMNMKTLGMDFEALEKQGLFKYLDLVTVRGEGASDAVQQILKSTTDFGAKRLVIDSISALGQMMSSVDTRVALHSVIARISKSLDVTTVVVAEVPFGKQEIGYGMEEFVADGVILLTHGTEGTVRKMRLELLKMRGTPISRSAFEYHIDAKNGGLYVITIPHGFKTEASDEKLSSGSKVLDKMLRGGLFKSSVTLIKGPSGVGKTALSLLFLASRSLKPGKRLFVSFEEPVNQVVRLGEGLGYSILSLEKQGTLVLESLVPEGLALPEYYKIIDEMIEQLKPDRMVVDGLTSVQHVMPRSDFNEFCRYLQLKAKNKGIVLLTTMETTEAILGGETALSIVVDNIINLRYREQPGRPIGRELSVIKTRGSSHERRRVDFVIGSKGFIIQA